MFELAAFPELSLANYLICKLHRSRGVDCDMLKQMEEKFRSRMEDPLYIQEEGSSVLANHCLHAVSMCARVKEPSDSLPIVAIDVALVFAACEVVTLQHAEWV